MAIRCSFLVASLLALHLLTTSCKAEILPHPASGSVSLNKQAWQKSTATATTDDKQQPVAEKAVDGNSDDSFNHGSCSSTTKQERPWWIVDLGVEYRVNRVVITTAREEDRTLSDVTISVGDTFDPANKHLFNPLTFTQCVHISGKLRADDNHNEILCSQPVKGRYVSVYLNKNSWLVICEFQVHGTRVTADKTTDAPADTPGDTQGATKYKTIVIVGGVVGTIVVLALFSAFIAIMCKRKRRAIHGRNSEDQSPPPYEMRAAQRQNEKNEGARKSRFARFSLHLRG